MKILHVVSQLTPGGAEKVVLELAGEQARIGHDVSVLTPFDVGASQVCPTPQGVKLRFLLDSPGSRLAIYWAMLRYLAAKLRETAAFDVIHGHLTFGAAFAFMFRTLHGRKGPVVLETNHSAGMPMNPKVRWVRSQIARKFDEVVLVVDDSYWRQRGTRFGFPVSLIANGIDMAALARIERKDATPARILTVGTVGMFRADRVPAVLVEIFQNVYRQFGDASLEFLWVGGGALFDTVRHAVDATELRRRMTFFGVSKLPAEQAASMDVFVSLNVGPLTGLGAIEAAAIGTPLVGYQIDSAYTMKDGDWIWSSHDTTLVAGKVVELLRDKIEARATANRQRAHVIAHYSLESACSAYEAIYLQHLEGR